MFLPHPRVGSLRDREVACSASDRNLGSKFESCVWRTVSSHSSHHPQGVLLAKFSLYVHKGGLKPDSFHFCSTVQVAMEELLCSEGGVRASINSGRTARKQSAVGLNTRSRHDDPSLVTVLLRHFLRCHPTEHTTLTSLTSYVQLGLFFHIIM